MVQIINPLAPQLSVSEAVQNAARPFQSAVEEYGQGNIDIAKSQMENFYRTAMQQRQLDSEKQLAMMRDKMYLDRQDMRDKTMMSRVQLSKNQDALTAIRKDLLQNGVAVPPQKPGEATEDYISRLSDLSASHVADTNKSMGGRLFDLKDQVDTIDQKLGQLSQSKPIDDATVNMEAMANAKGFLDQLQVLNKPAYDKLSAAEAGGGHLWWTRSPQDMMTAIKTAGATDLWNQFKDGVKLSLQQNQEKLVPKENAEQYKALLQTKGKLEDEQRIISTRHPMALDHYYDLIQQKNHQEAADKLATAGTTLLPPPPAGRSGDVTNFAIDANSRNAGSVFSPAAGVAPMTADPQNPMLATLNNPMALPVFGGLPTNGGQAFMPNLPTPQFSASDVAANQSLGSNIFPTPMARSAIVNSMPALSALAKKIHGSGGNWQDFQGNLTTPQTSGVDPNSIQHIQEADPALLYQAALMYQQQSQQPNNIAPAF